MAPALVFLLVLQSTPAPSPAATLAEAVAVETAQDPSAAPPTAPDEAGAVSTDAAGAGEAGRPEAADEEEDEEEEDEAEGEDDDDDAGVRPVRDDLPSTAPPPPPHESTPEPRPAGDPTFPVYGIAFLVMCGAELGACFGVLPGFAAAAAGGLAINSTGDAVSARRGTWLTAVASVVGGVAAALVGVPSVIVGAFVLYAGLGGSLFLGGGREDPGQVAVGAAILVGGVLIGSAIGAILPTWTYLATAEPVPE